MKKAVIIVAVGILIVIILLMSVGIATHGPQESSRAECEIAALSAALESYKADHGTYPRNPGTDQLKTNATFDPILYIPSSEFLYRALSGELAASEGKDKVEYMSFKAKMLQSGKDGRLYLVDPQGNSYGYSTIKASSPNSQQGNNAEFDLWSTCGGKRQEDKKQWIKNW